MNDPHLLSERRRDSYFDGRFERRGERFVRAYGLPDGFTVTAYGHPDVGWDITLNPASIWDGPRVNLMSMLHLFPEGAFGLSYVASRRVFFVSERHLAPFLQRLDEVLTQRFYLTSPPASRLTWRWSLLTYGLMMGGLTAMEAYTLRTGRSLSRGTFLDQTGLSHTWPEVWALLPGRLVFSLGLGTVVCAIALGWVRYIQRGGAAERG